MTCRHLCSMCVCVRSAWLRAETSSRPAQFYFHYIIYVLMHPLSFSSLVARRAACQSSLLMPFLHLVVAIPRRAIYIYIFRQLWSLSAVHIFRMYTAHIYSGLINSLAMFDVPLYQLQRRLSRVCCGSLARSARRAKPLLLVVVVFTQDFALNDTLYKSLHFLGLLFSFLIYTHAVIQTHTHTHICGEFCPCAPLIGTLWEFSRDSRRARWDVFQLNRGRIGFL